MPAAGIARRRGVFESISEAAFVIVEKNAGMAESADATDLKTYKSIGLFYDWTVWPLSAGVAKWQTQRT
jgi:hypothetical protein